MKNKSKKKSNKSFFSIKLRVSLLCTCAILIAVTVNFIFMFNASKNTITESTESTMEDLTSSYNNNVSEAVQQASRTSNMLMGYSQITDFVNSGGNADSSEVAELVTQFQGSDTTIEDSSIVDANGKVLYSTNSKLIGQNLSNESYFTKMVSTGLNAQSDVFKSETSGEACIYLAIPLRSSMQNNSSANDAQTATETSSDTESSSSDTSKSSTSEAATTVPNAGQMGPDESAVTNFTGAIITSVKVSAFSSTVADAKVGNYKSSYSFMLDNSGNVIYHPDETLIGTKLEIKEINNIISKIKNGKTKGTGMLTYTFKGIEKYAAYDINEKNQWLLVMTSEKAEVLKSLNSVATNTIAISIFLAVILSLFAYLFAGTITKSIMQITKLINKTSELDFAEDPSFKVLSSRRDETGEMSRAIEKMRDNLKTMIVHISEVSGKINESSNNLNNITSKVNDHASDNSATAEELSASMQETAATTEQIYSTIEQVGNNSKDIADKVTIGAKLSTDLMSRASELKESTTDATVKTRKIYEEVKKKTDAAIEQSKAVDKISILSQTIKDIAGQTSLLALNASIEAARAGDKGSGFSVVASEIGNLANESTKTVSHIAEVVEEVYLAVNNMSKSLEQTLSFLETNVLPDYNNFINSSEEYQSDAGIMNETMEGIQKQIDILNSNVQGISESIAEINMMVNESSKGVNDVAASNTNIVSLTANTQDMTKENTEHADSLQEIVDKFKLD